MLALWKIAKSDIRYIGKNVNSGQEEATALQSYFPQNRVGKLEFLNQLAVTDFHNQCKNPQEATTIKDMQKPSHFKFTY